MRILYAIQGTGNGHIAVAKDLIPRFKEYADVDILISGCQVDLKLPYPVKYNFKGLGFVFGKKGGIDYLETYKKSKLKSFYKEVTSLEVEKYDLVLSDFEPVSAWACKLKSVPCIGISHQVCVTGKHAPIAKNQDVIGKAVLKYYAPTKYNYGFHFKSYNNTISTPIIRKEIREKEITNKGHFTVYLPAYSDKRIIKILSLFPEINWQVFSKHTQKPYNSNNINVIPIDNNLFIESMVSCAGVLCGAGFQTPSEVLFLKKKLLVIPMKGQYEQQCNAVALKELGITVLKNLRLKRKYQIDSWLNNDKIINIDMPNIAPDFVSKIINLKFEKSILNTKHKESIKFSSFKKKLLSKVFYSLGYED